MFLIDTPVTPITSVLPLLFVISVTAVKQGYEDLLRHRSDAEINHRSTVIIRDGEAQPCCKAQDIKVGDIVKIFMNEEFPCDMVLLSSEDSKGHCFITTANLDGETNLKTHYSQQETLSLRTPEALGNLRATITCKPQTADLYTFQGVMHFGHDADPQSLGPENLLLRGARLKNTPWVYGCAIYTGKETKMALNSTAKKAKFSRVERKLNTFLILFFVILMMGCVIPTAFKYWWDDKKGDTPWYFQDDDNDDDDVTPAKVLETCLAFMVLINYIIPISLYVTIEMQKFIGSLFFNYDIGMYDTDLDEPAVANTSDLNEELGQIEYLFTDKTGTLTENSMTFRKCVIGKREFEEVDGVLCEKVGPKMIPVSDPAYSDPPAEMTDFLRVLVLCHTVRVDRSYSPISVPQTSGESIYAYSAASKWRHLAKKKKLETPNKSQEEEVSNSSNNASISSDHVADSNFYYGAGHDYEYQASSPDEKAFVEACYKYGTIYHGMTGDVHEVSFQRQMHRFKLLETMPFDAMRKRMSVVIRDSDGKIFLLCKGAEVAIFDRVVEGDIATTQKCIDQYAMSGYRTLCLARRKLNEAEYQKLSNDLAEARLSLVDRDSKVADVYDEWESNLTLLGATAVEDKLQGDVAETITALRNAGIKVWVLTGDKEETAVNISHSAGHFDTTMQELRLAQMSSASECQEMLLHLLNKAKKTEDGTKYSFVMDGKSLAFALRSCSENLRELCSLCSAVLCCRLSPIQKAEIVKLVKHSPEQPVTAAIGDGANDVSMIQEADVGFGIMGKEGRQAVCNSDYAFGKFRFLRRALLLHGHFYYHRLAILVKYFFYKNVAWITCQIYFAIFSYWSQQTLYDPFYLTFYNMTSTSLPILIYGIFEQCKPIKKILEDPKLYRSISKNEALSWKIFSEWMVLALWHSLVFFFGMYFMEDDNTSLFKSGYSIGTYDFGAVIACNGIVAVNMKLMIETYYWCWPIVISFAFTAVGNLIMAAMYTSVFWPSWMSTLRNLYGVPAMLYSSPSVWLCLLITLVVALLPDICIRVLRDHKASLAAYDQRKFGSNEGISPAETGLNTPMSTSVDPSYYGFHPSNQSTSSQDSGTDISQNNLSGRITLANGKTEMTSRSHQEGPPLGSADIE
ncbi:phospholipid-transporting ATPase, partial [Plakobranchus ocellatus]